MVEKAQNQKGCLAFSPIQIKVKFFKHFIGLFIFIFSSLTPVWAVDIDILVCPQGCGPLVADLALSELIKQIDPNFRLHPKATGGYTGNLGLMDNPDVWKTTIFATNDDTLSFAPKGGKHPFKKFIPKAVNAKFKLLYGFYWGTTGHYFITLNPRLKKVLDLKGKKIGLGIPAQSDWGMNPTLDFEYGYGITEDNTTLMYLGPKKLGKALLTGEVDAIVAALGTGLGFTRWLPAGIFRELKKSRKKLYYIGHEAGFREKMNKALDTSYIKVDIPAGTLPGQTAVINTIADRDYKAAHESFPENLAYQIVLYAAKLGPKMMLTMKIWQTWSPEIMVAGLSEENAHPGAIRAFKELGWWDLTKRFKAAKLP